MRNRGILKLTQNPSRMQDMINELKKREISVMLNLHHFTIPIWYAEKAGKEYLNYVTE